MDTEAKSTLIKTGDLIDAVGMIQFRIGAWEDFGYEKPPTPECKSIPPLGERSAEAINSGHEAIREINRLLKRLHEIRGELIGQLCKNDDIVLKRNGIIP